MDKFIEIGWPDIQKYQERNDFYKAGYDPEKNVWFIPESMLNS